MVRGGLKDPAAVEDLIKKKQRVLQSEVADWRIKLRLELWKETTRKGAEMAKTERLFRLIQYLHEHGHTPAAHLAQKLGISKRTLFRDLNSLAVLNLPIHNDPGKGYSLIDDTQVKFGGFSINDADLILFCLNHNPLNNSPYFRRRLLNLKDILQQLFAGKSIFKKDSVLEFDSSYVGLAEKHYENLVKFLFAIYHKNQVFLLEKGSFTSNEAFLPIGVKFKGDSATYILSSKKHNRNYRVDAKDLQGISISSGGIHERPRQTDKSEKLAIQF